MLKAQQSTTETLFHHWRRGDSSAGKAMAQRFTDWYYAIAISRLGEAEGEKPFRAACAKFSKGVVKVDDTRRLLGWAHNIARKQLHDRVDGGRIPDGDLPNVFTRKQQPKALLSQVRKSLPNEMRVLEMAYKSASRPENLQEVLRARYAVKTHLRDNHQVPFKITPSVIDPDRAPLPLYESGQLASVSEDVHFELYMLNDQEVCQDVAEFAHYAIALRGGVGGKIPDAVSETPPPRPQSAQKQQPVVDEPVVSEAPPKPIQRELTPVEEPAAGGNGMLIAMGIFAVLALMGLAFVVLR